jgi:Lysyl oxidase
LTFASPGSDNASPVAHRSPPVLLAAAALCSVLAAVLALALPDLGQGSSSSPERRPDLVQRTPSDLVTRADGGRFELGFTSAVENRGDGPLRVHGRLAAGSTDMAATQFVRRADGSSTRVPGVGAIRYTRSAGHHHWHLLRFDRYELRRASDHSLVRPDRKTGFCLGDRYETSYRSPYKPSRGPHASNNCRAYEPGATAVAMAISVGYGDDYHAYLEGQSLDVTGLSAGQYELVHRVNAGRRLREKRYANNAASVRFVLSWPNGTDVTPRARVLERCPASARCAA